MNQSERRIFLLKAFLAERPELSNLEIAQDASEQRTLLRALLNTRQPGLPSQTVLDVQDAYLQYEINKKGITKLSDLKSIQPHTYLWQGDITTLGCGAIVNAANNQMTGCWAPNHMCIDNCIHTFAGVQLRWECDQLMKAQGHLEPTGSAKITKAYNLPCKYIIHTVGPIVSNQLSNKHCKQLISSYRSCYKLAKDNNIDSIAFCCISTGVFGFPQQEAAQIAIQTIQEIQQSEQEPIDIIFNVFLDEDLRIYTSILKNK